MIPLFPSELLKTPEVLWKPLHHTVFVSYLTVMDLTSANKTSEPLFHPAILPNPNASLLCLTCLCAVHVFPSQHQQVGQRGVKAGPGETPGPLWACRRMHLPVYTWHTTNTSVSWWHLEHDSTFRTQKRKPKLYEFWPNLPSSILVLEMSICRRCLSRLGQLNVL